MEHLTQPRHPPWWAKVSLRVATLRRPEDFDEYWHSMCQSYDEVLRTTGSRQKANREMIRPTLEWLWVATQRVIIPALKLISLVVSFVKS